MKPKLDEAIRDHTALGDMKTRVSELAKKWDMRSLSKGNERNYVEGDHHAGVIGRGDITSWSTATSKPFGSVFKPFRPLCNGPVNREFRPIKSVGNVVPFKATPLVHDPEAIVMPQNEKDTSVAKEIEKLEKEIESREKRQRMVNALDTFWANCIVKKAASETTPKPIPALEGEPIEADELARLSRLGECVPRD